MNSDDDKDICQVLSKEVFVSYIKQMIRSSNPPAEAEILCRQVDDANHLAEFLKRIREQIMQGGSNPV